MKQATQRLRLLQLHELRSRGIGMMVRRIVAASWGQALSALILLFSFRAYSGLLGPEPFGQAMLGLGVVSLIDGVAGMAFGQVLALLLKDFDDRKTRIALGLGLGLRFSAWLGVVVAAGLVAALLAWGPKGAVQLFPFAAGLCLTEPLRVCGQTLCLLERRYTMLSSWHACEALASLAASLALLDWTGGDPAAVVAGAISGRLAVSFGFARIVLGPPTVWWRHHAGAQAMLPRAVSVGWSVAVMAPLGWLGMFADRYIVGATTSLTAAGVLAALSGAILRPFAITSAGLTNLYRPDLLDEAAGREPVHANPLRQWMIAASAIGLAGVIGVAVVGPYVADFLIRFATPGLDRTALMVLIAISQVVVLQTHALDNLALANGRSHRLLTGQVLATVLGLPLIFVLAIEWGAIGACVGRIANESLKLGAAWYVAGTSAPRRLRRSEIGQ